MPCQAHQPGYFSKIIMTAKEIPFIVPLAIHFIKKFSLIANKKAKNLAIELNGAYGNKKVISSVSPTNWKKTRKALSEALEEKHVSKDDIVYTLDILDNNCDSV